MEDEYLIAVLIEEILEAAGCVVSGPIPRLPEALDAADHDDFDAAVLDVNLGGNRIDPVAKALSRRNVPFIFVTGYGEGVLSEEFAERPRLCKPFRVAELICALSSVVRPPLQEAACSRAVPISGEEQ